MLTISFSLHSSVLVPAILNVSIPAAGKDIEWEQELSQNLAWQYTAILEKLLASDVETRDSMVPLEQLKQALYNVRQHESFLKIILVSYMLTIWLCGGGGVKSSHGLR